MSKLNEFIAGVRSGMAKTSHFEVELTVPPALANVEPLKSNMRKILLFCDQAPLPGYSFGSNQVRSYGEFREVPYEKLYEQVQLSFYVDVDMHVKALFDRWAELIQDPVTRDFSYYSNYTTDSIRIFVKDTQDNSRYMCVLNKAYPKAIAPIQLDYSGKEVMKLQVTFAYEFATFVQMGPGNSDNEMFIIPSNSQSIGAYNYGYQVQQFAEIPNQYFNNFQAYQDKYTNQLMSYENQVNSVLNQKMTVGGVKTNVSLEDIGVKTGFGGIFI